MSKKLTIEDRIEILKQINPNIELKNIFIKNNAVHCKYKCECGVTDIKRWDRLKNSQACRKCVNKKSKLNFDEIKDKLKILNPEIILLNINRIDKGIVCEYECSCGNIAFKKLGNLQQGQKCSKCSGGVRYNLEEKIEIIKNINKNIILISEESTKNGKTKCNFICECGEIHSMNFDDLKQGRLCKKCGIKKKELKLGV